VLAGRTYVKVFGAASPDLRLSLANERGRAEIGGGLGGSRASLVARVFGGASASRSLVVLRDGRSIATVPVRGSDFEHRMEVSGEGDYRIQVMRGNAVDGLTTPVRLGRALPPVRRAVSPRGSRPSTRPGGRSSPRARLRVRVFPSRLRRGRPVRLLVRVTAGGRPVRGALIRVGSRRVRTDRRGIGRLRVRLTGRAGRRTVRASLRGFRAGRASLRVVSR
jgi:hypothetical protein